MELIEIVKKRLEAKGWDFASDYWDDEELASFHEIILETEAALRQQPVSGMLKCASCENTAKKDGLDCYGKCHICTQAF